MKIELTLHELVLINGALKKAITDEFGNEEEINCLDEVKNIIKKIKKKIQ